MAAYGASIKKALDPEQQDLIKHKEHCSADPEKLATVGRALGHQVRIKRNDDEYGLYTVSEVRPENPDKIVRMGKAAESDSVRATSLTVRSTRRCHIPPSPTLMPNATANSSSGSTMMARPRGSLPSHPTAGTSSRTPTSKPSVSGHSWRARVLAVAVQALASQRGP